MQNCSPSSAGRSSLPTILLHVMCAELSPISSKPTNLGSLHSSEPRRSFSGDDIWAEDAFAAARPRTTNAVPESGGKEWHLLVVNDPKVVNAMATFGNIVVFTGILPICKDEQGLASVLGHEIGHLPRHPQERYSSAKILIFVAFLLQSVGLDWGFSTLVSKLLLELPNSRKQELEADTVGLRLIARACYDPRSAVEMHLRLANHERMHGHSSLEFLRTHPGASRRVKHLEEQIPEANAIRASSPRCTIDQDAIDRFSKMSRWVDRAAQEVPFQL
ncbi:peptidase family M48-domain-containing protein [Pisolithus marmoratus]|nr:peptidase family M48-domain-containing protein [Pisolithus marmoratus]